jgi:ubiquinone/menaquinone biosynthesis C-methylase UbiE
MVDISVNHGITVYSTVKLTAGGGHVPHSRNHIHQSHSHGEKTRGLLLDRGWRYDLEVWFFDTFVVRGEIDRLRHRVLDQADLSAGDSLLDVGCGTGTLTIQAARRLGGAGRVIGIDPAPRQIARARSKARRASVAAEFQPGVIEHLPFPDATFDVVTSTLMMHHLPDDLRRQGLAEIARVLRPQGRLVLADFDYPDGDEPTAEPASNGFGGTGALTELLDAAGFGDIEVEHIRFGRSHRGWVGASIITARNR